MKLEDIQAAWAKDSKIDQSMLTEESLQIPQLHNKYYKMLTTERLTWRKQAADLKQLELLRREYYLGILDEETLKEKGWQPEYRKILRTDVDQYVEADSLVIELTLRVGLQLEKIDVLENIIRTINNRNFIIKNALDFMRFSNGLN